MALSDLVEEITVQQGDEKEIPISKFIQRVSEDLHLYLSTKDIQALEHESENDHLSYAFVLETLETFGIKESNQQVQQ
jgi:excinuclease UvrABC helicase subunit UvrB